MLEMKDVSFQYANSDQGVWDINLIVKKGECIVFTGPSGGGKSTLIRLINGLAPSHFQGTLTGSISINGEPVKNISSWRRGAVVGSVFQDPKSQFFSSELAGEIAFACENYGLPHDEIVERTNASIRAFNLESLQKRPLDLLSSGEKQRTAIASVYALKPPLYACDEPTANLDDEGALELAQTLTQLKVEGHTLIVAEHRLAWLAGIADRYVYVQNGRILWECGAKEMASMPEAERKKFGLRSAVRLPMPKLSAPYGNSDPCIACEALSCKRKNNTIFADLSFKAWPGQVVAITGHNGAGKTTMAHILSGLQRESDGRILVGGKVRKPRSRSREIWYGSNDTSAQFFTNSITNELLLGTAPSNERLEQARSLLKQLGLYDFKDAHPATLSGGQKQRLSIACGILSGRRILILDEPTSGLDGKNMRMLAVLFKEQAAHGKTIILITHDRELIGECCSFANAFVDMNDMHR